MIQTSFHLEFQSEYSNLVISESYFLFSGCCERRLITLFRANLKLVFCTSCSKPLTCSANGHLLRYILTFLKFQRQLRLQHGEGCSQSLYRVIGVSQTMIFVSRFCEVIDAPSDLPSREASDRFYRPRYVPGNATGLKSLAVLVDLSGYFSARDVFGMCYSDYHHLMTNPDIRLRGLPTSDK